LRRYVPTRDDRHPAPHASRAAAPVRFLLAAALVGVALRVIFGLAYWTQQPLTRDEQEYLSLARSLAGGHGFTYDDAFGAQSFPPFSRAPGYPAFLAIVGGGTAPASSVPHAVQIAQAVVGGIGVLAVGLFSTRLFGPRAGRAGAVLAAIYPPLVWIAGYALSEAVFWPLGLACAWAYDRARAASTASLGAPLICGALCGAGTLVRPSLILFIPLAALALAARRRWTQAAALVLGVCLVVGPWTWRNYDVHHRWMIVAADGGVTFWTGNNPLAVGEGDMAANPAIKHANQVLRAAHPDLTEEQMERVYYREGLVWIASHPVDFLALEMKKLFHTILPTGPSYRLHSARYAVASVVSYGVIALLAMASTWCFRSRLAASPGLFWLLLSSWLVCLVFFPQERFRIPIVDPTFIILASGLAEWRRKPQVWMPERS
jgi:4-amino-4-deoxy-L-arabinose transferase-like glycosyltransferase